MTHSIFSPSSAQRWVECSASLVLGEHYPDSSNPAADFGTFVHEIAHKVLEKLSEKPVFDIEKAVSASKKIIAESVNGGIYESKLCEIQNHIFNYLKSVEEYMNDDHAIDFELRVKHNDDLYGTVDFIAYNASTRCLTVVDLKTGRAIVPAVDNLQLSIYALCGFDFCDSIPESVVLKISQSTDINDPIKTFVINDPVTYFNRLRNRVLNSIELTKKYFKQYKELNYLNKEAFSCGNWCRYCKVLPHCEAQNSQIQKILKHEDQFLPKPSTLTPEKITKVLNNKALILRWIASVEQYAKTAIDYGVTIPGYAVDNLYSNRYWSNPDELKKYVTQIYPEYTDRIYAEKQLLSPAKLEKYIPKSELEPFTSRTLTGYKLVKTKTITQ